MSLGRRLVPRGPSTVLRAAATGPAAVPTRQPLLFLYPRWLESAATAAHRVRHAAVDDDRQPHASLSAAVVEAQANGATWERDVGSGREQPGRDAATWTQTELSEGQSAATTKVNGDSSPLLRQRDGHNTDSTPDESLSTPTAAKLRADPEFVRRVESTHAARIAKVIRQAKEKERYNRAKIRQLRKERARTAQSNEVFRAPADPDWQRIVKYLITSTRRPVYDAKKMWLKLVVPQDVIPMLLYSPDHTPVSFRRWHGCQVQILPRSEDMADREIVLAGSRRNVHGAMKEVQQLCRATASSFGNGIDVADIDLQQAAAIFQTLRHTKPRRVDSVPRPAQWNARTLVDFLIQVTSINMPNHLHGTFYQRGENHGEMVEEILRDVLYTPENDHALSTTACHIAMRYFSRRNQAGDLRAIFALMQRRGLWTTAETFNIALQTFSVRTDPSFFEQLVQHMRHGRVSPDAYTWVALISAAPNSKARLRLFSSMKLRGLLQDIPVLQAACVAVIGDVLEPTLAHAKDYKDLISSLDTEFDRRWMSLAAANQMLKRMAAHGRLIDCVGLYEVMLARGLRPNAASLNAVLAACKEHLNAVGALEFYHAACRLGCADVDDFTFSILFSMALRLRQHTLARVVWRYACLKESTASRMRYIMRRFYPQSQAGVVSGMSVVRYVSGAGSCDLDSLVWRSRGSASLSDSKAVGNETPSTEATSNINYIPGPLPASSHPVSVDEPLADPPKPFYDCTNANDVETLKKLLRGIVNHDLRVGEAWEPVRPLHEMLLQAFEVDERVKTLDLRGQGRFDWLHAHRLDIPLRHKESRHELVWT